MPLEQFRRRQALAILAGSIGFACIAPRRALAVTESERWTQEAVERAYRRLKKRILPQVADFSFGELIGCRHDPEAPHEIPVRVPADAFSIGSDFRSNCGIDFEPRADYGRHRGVDMAAPGRTPVLACADGWVHASRREETPGDEIWIEHGGLRTRYIHLGERLVAEGQRVKRGEVIGSVGATGDGSAGINHLHLEVFRSSDQPCCERVNPHAHWFDGPGRITLFDPRASERFAAKPLGLTFPLPAKGDVDHFLHDLAVLIVQWYQ